LDSLSETSFAEKEDNTVEKIFYGRLPIAAAMSMYYFTKQSLLQHLLHLLKYRGKYDVGVQFGKMIGNRIKDVDRFANIDYITPIPLSKKREKERGYNQAEAVANGIMQTTGIPLLDNITMRQKNTETQTHKSRQERWENMQNTFIVGDTQTIENKNILLVDDVVTTGATLESCASVIQQITNTKVYIATVALASN
jgi:ComF family protein